MRWHTAVPLIGALVERCRRERRPGLSGGSIRSTNRIALVPLAATLTILAACGDGAPTVAGPSDKPLLASAGSNSADWEQCANNGRVEGPNPSAPCEWIPSVLNVGKAKYFEGEVIPFRFAIHLVDVLPNGKPTTFDPNKVRTVRFTYGFNKAANGNYDFLAKFNTTEKYRANLCSADFAPVNGIYCAPGSPAGTLLAPYVSSTGTGQDSPLYDSPDGVNHSVTTIDKARYLANVPASVKPALDAALTNWLAKGNKLEIDLFGGRFSGITSTVDNVVYNVGGNDVTATITVRFKANRPDVLMAFGAHFARLQDWRLVNYQGGAGQSGSPFHIKVDNIDGTSVGALGNNVAGGVVLSVPQAKIELSPLTAINPIGDPHTVTVTVSEKGDAGDLTYSPAAGETVTHTLTGSGGAVPVLDAAASSCDDQLTNASGQCTIVFTSQTAGTVTIHAASDVKVGASTVHVESDGIGDNTGDATKTFVSASLTWTKVDGSAKALGGATFSVCRTGGSCQSVADDGALDEDKTPGSFQMTGLALGEYTVTETAAPAGYNLDATPQKVTLTTSNPIGTLATAFVNTKPDAFITIGTTATNSVGEPHTFEAKMTAIPNGGSPVSIADFTISVSPAPSTLGTTTCAALDAATNSKTCSLTINSNAAGTFTANASASATIGAVTLNRDTDPATTSVDAGTGGSGPAIKTYVAPLLVITKTPDLPGDPGGTVHPGDKASFTVTVKNDAPLGGGTANGVTMTDTLPAGLSWTETETKCAIDQVTVNDPATGSPVSRDRIICNIGSLAPQASFAVTVTSGTIPASILQRPPSPAGTAIEIDGDLVDGATPGSDWDKLPSSVFSCVSPIKGCDIDLPTGRGDNSFGQGTKEDSPVPTVVSGSIPNNKSDLLRFYVASERFLTTDFLYLAWSRVQEPNGTTNMDFELNQSTTLTSNGVTPVRTAGDILVRYDLAQGGTVPKLFFHKWITSGSSSLCEAANSVPCWDTKKELTTDVKAAINTGTVTDPMAGTTLSPRTFGEASISLQGSGFFEPGKCTVFGLAYLKSRSSDAFGSEMKDFIAPIPVNISNCAPVTLDNTAHASATNFAPTPGNLGKSISDDGHIRVTETGTASLDVAPATVRLALAGAGDGRTAGVGSASVSVIEQTGRRDVRRAGELWAGVAPQVGRGERGLAQPPRGIGTGDDVTIITALRRVRVVEWSAGRHVVAG